MPEASRSRAARLALMLMLVVAVAVVAGACSLLPPGTVPAAFDTPLVRFEATGGECPEGECGLLAEIYRDGRVTRSDGMAQAVDAPSLARVIREVEGADYGAILAVPFEGECPRNVDGQEQVYTFFVGSDPIVIASCTTLVDVSREPFRTVHGILFGLGG